MHTMNSVDMKVLILHIYTLNKWQCFVSLSSMELVFLSLRQNLCSKMCVVVILMNQLWNSRHSSIISEISLSLYSFCALHRACTVLRAQRSITYARARCVRAHTRTHCFMRLNKLNNKCLQKQITLSCQSSVCLASLFNTNFIWCLFFWRNM